MGYRDVLYNELIDQPESGGEDRSRSDSTTDSSTQSTDPAESASSGSDDPQQQPGSNGSDDEAVGSFNLIEPRDADLSVFEEDAGSDGQ